MSACTSSVSEVKEVVKVARNEKRMFGKQTVLFMDEVHRFNKLQQDAFLPHVEDGTVRRFDCLLLGLTFLCRLFDK